MTIRTRIHQHSVWFWTGAALLMVATISCIVHG